MSNDQPDDLDPDPVPEPDAEPTAAERARARAFAEIVDKVVAGRPPAAMSAEDRALVEVATVIRSAHRPVELAESKQRALIEHALRGAVEGRGRGTVPPIVGAEELRRGNVPVIPISRWRARAPWLVAGASSLVAAAAILILFLRPTPHAEAPAQAKAPAPHLRTPDQLIGQIPRERDADAVSRIDILFADRLDGYRERALGGK